MYTDACENCGSKIDINEPVCSTCGIVQSKTINVRRANLIDEKQALETRYSAAVENSKLIGVERKREYLENEVISNGKAIINTNWRFVWDWLFRNTVNYSSYRRNVIDGARLPAAFENDSKRCTIDAILFGSHSDIIYAALTIDETGLASYGPISVVLNDSIQRRTSALEKNSFFFIDDAIANGWKIGDRLPLGHFSTWDNKHKLVVAKLHSFLRSDMTDEEVNKLVLNSASNRAGDDFVELYIYGKIVPSVIEKLRVHKDIYSTMDSGEMLQVEEMRSKLTVEIYE